MTWKEFKEAVERQGVSDDTKIRYIDMSGYDGAPSVVFDDHGEAHVE